MPKLKLINILKNKILEQGPIGIDATADDEDYGENYGFDDKGKLKKVGFADKEEIKKLMVYPKIGKCPSWSREEIDGILNGDLPESKLKKLKHHPYQKLDIQAADDFDKMEDEYFSKTGEKFNLTDTYRTYDEQWDIFDFGYCQKTGLFRKVNNLETQVAPPGTSNHGWGMAVDLGPTKAREWIKKNGGTWDWHWGEVPSEPWHFTYNFK